MNDMDMASYLSAASAMPEFVGMTVLDTIGLVIPGVDPSLRAQMEAAGIACPYSALGLISSRTGAAGQLCAVDEAVKNSNTHLVSFDLPRDTKGWGGHGNYIVIGGHDVSDVREAVSVALDLTRRNAGEVYINSAGHLEFAYSARAGEVLNRAFGVPTGAAFGFMAGSPAAIGMLMADRAVKSADLTVTRYMTPSIGTSHTNEIILAFTGDTSATLTGVLTAREVGLALLEAMGGKASGPSTPYL